MSVTGDPVLWSAPSKNTVRTPPSGPGPIPTDRLTGPMGGIAEGGAPMGRHRKPTRWTASGFGW